MNENPEVPEPITYKEFKPSKTSFELDFNANSNLKLENNISDSYLKFPTVLFGNETKEIKCSLTNKTKNVDYYKMVCSTREKINAQVKNLKIKFPVKKKLRILADETSYNKTLYFNNEKENEIITYEYDGDSKDFFGRKKKNGLSAGAIVAIILASVAVVVAVGIVFIFLNKRTNTPPIVKNQPDFNIVNSTSNINN